MRLLPLLLLCACTAGRVQLPTPPPQAEELTVFVHGYRGAFLADAQGERAWLSVGDTLSRGERSLALPFAGERARPPRFGALRPDGPLTRFTALPLLVKYDVYKGFLEFGREQLPGLIAFDYDWRQDNRESAARLCRLLRGLSEARGGRVRLNLVAHSMGGLVALHCLRYGGEAGAGEGPVTWAGAAHVARVVFVGTPFAGAPGLFDDFSVGTPVGRNRALLSPAALFTFPAAFQLLPRESDFFVDAAGAPAPLDAYAPAAWLQEGWGVFADGALREDAAYRAQLARMLQARAALARALADAPGAPPPPFRALVVVGVGRPLVQAYRVVDGRPSFEGPVLGDGDGSVLAARALPPAPLPAERLESRAEHVALMGDAAVQRAIARFLASR